MIEVSIKEFKNKATALIREKRPILVKRRDKSVGLFIPLDDIDNLPLEIRLIALERLTDIIKAEMKKRGLSEEEVFKDFETWKKKQQ